MRIILIATIALVACGMGLALAQLPPPSGITQTCTVNQAKTLIFKGGVLVGGTCNS